MTATKHPRILFASMLRGGQTVLLGERGWVGDPREAVVARDAQAAAALERRGKDEVARNNVVDVYLSEVVIGADGAPEPLHYREKRRLAGPSVRPDLWPLRVERSR